MIIKKDKLLDKLMKKDYNNKLEKILSTKDYKEDVKSLLLDILYKIEMSYKDYQKVKNNVLSEEEYIGNIIQFVKDDCDSIKFVRQNSKDSRVAGKTFYIDKEKKEILCYPIARKLLYSIYKIHKSENIIRNESDLLNSTLTNMLNIGNNINNVEPLRDFNGFSWNIAKTEIENIYYNIIYQDLILLVGNTLLEEWTNKNDSMVDYKELFYNDLIKKYGKKISIDIMYLLKKASVLLDISISTSSREKCIERKKWLSCELEAMKNRESYIVDITNKKKELIKKIKNLDIIINNKDLLVDEYDRRNRVLPIEKKIFSIRVLLKKLNHEREEAFERVHEYNELMNSKKFIKRYEELEREYDYLKFADIEDLDEEIYKTILSLQKEVIRCLKIKIRNANEKSDLIKIMYEIRYFNLLPVTYDKNINQISKISRSLISLKKEFVRKAINLDIFNKIFKETKQNEEVLKNIFSLEIISLEDINLKIIKDKNNFYIQFFDGDIADEKFKIGFEVKKEDLKVKINRKVKLI